MNVNFLDFNPNQSFCGTPRQQNRVVVTFGGGISLAITAEHHRHEFKILQIYEIPN